MHREKEKAHTSHTSHTGKASLFASRSVRGQGPTKEQARKGGREGRVPCLAVATPFPRPPTSSGTSRGLTG
jgi:hypothetical protein